MSARGHSRHFERATLTSGLPLRTDINAPTRLVRFVPTAEGGDLFDHLVGQQLERVRHGEAEGSGGLEINDQFVLERELNGQIARICAPQNLVNIGRGRSRPLQLIDTIRDQTAALSIDAKRIDRRQIEAGRQTNNEIAARRCQRARRHDEATTLLSKIRQYSFDVVGVAYLGRRNSYPHLRSSGLNHPQKSYVWRDFRNMHDSNTAQSRRYLVEIGEPFPADWGLEIVKACNFSSGMMQVRDETASDRIGYPSEDHRNRPRDIQCCRHYRICRSKDHIRREPYDFLRHAVHPLLAFTAEPVVEPDVTALCPAEIL